METWITFTGLTFAGLFAAHFSATVTDNRVAPSFDKPINPLPTRQPIGRDHRAWLIEEGGG